MFSLHNNNNNTKVLIAHLEMCLQLHDLKKLNDVIIKIYD